jgi:sporulation protein YlmC with PRC-barrel domain
VTFLGTFEIRRTHMRTSILAALTAALLATSAVAQTTTPGTAPSGAPSDTRAANPAPTQEAKGPWHVRDFFRSAVYNMAGERIGDVNDIQIDESGKVTAVVIGVGGFLGIGEKEVSMPMDQVKRMVHSDGKTYFTVNANKDQLKAAPEFARPKT